MTDKYDMKFRVEMTLNRALDVEDYDQMCIDWKAFCTDPERYAYSNVVEMVLLWLDERIGEDPLNCEGC